MTAGCRGAGFGFIAGRAESVGKAGGSVTDWPELMVKEEELCLFLQVMNVRHIQLVEVSRLMDEVVEFVVAGDVFNVLMCWTIVVRTSVLRAPGASF